MSLPASVCPHCSKPVERTALFCPNCGGRLSMAAVRPTPTVAPEPPVDNIGRGLQALLVVGIVAVLAVGGYLLLPRLAPSGVAVATSTPATARTAAPSVTVIVPDITRRPQPAATPAPAGEYAPLSDREWQLLVKSPDAKTGNAYFVWACITQFDAATGPEGFLAQASNAKREYWYTDGDNAVFTGTAAQLADFVEHDVVAVRAIAGGSYSYDTQAGGNTTVPAFEVQSISVEGSCD